MRSFVSAPSSSQCGPQSSSTRPGDQPANPFTSFLRAVTSDTLQSKQIGSDAYASSHGSVLFADRVLSGEATKQQYPQPRSLDGSLPIDRLAPRELNPNHIRDPILFDPSSHQFIDEFHHRQHQQSTEWTHSFNSFRPPSAIDSKNASLVEQQQPSTHQQAQQPRPHSSFFPNVTPSYMPWMNYRQQNHLAPSYYQPTTSLTDTSLKPSAETTAQPPAKSVSFDVQLSRDEFLSQLNVQPEEYQPSHFSDTTTYESPTTKESMLDQLKARELADKLRSVDNEDLNQSEFLQFVDSLANGSIQIKENQVVDTKGSEVDWMSQENSNDEMIKHLEAAWSEAKDLGFISESDIDKFRAAMNSSALLIDPLTATSTTLEDPLSENVSGFQPEMVRTNLGPTGDYSFSPAHHQMYHFQPSNPYLQQEQQQSNESEIDLMGLALQLIREGKNNEAIQVLEAEVQKNSESSEGWRLLGQLHADNEQDVEAIICLTKGHDVDPFNLSSLLTLGVSLANEMDSTQALGHLRTWLRHHERFEHLVPQAKDDKVISPTNGEDLRREVTDLFHKAINIDPRNADLHVGLGVIYNISRQFNRAFEHFIQALHFGSVDEASSIWNKIGATLANAGCSDAALLAYHQSLALRPNYPRAWANLGIAHANLDLLDDALRFYLSALSLNPKATHLWHHIRTAVLHMGRYELLESIDNRNIDNLRNEFPGVVASDSLPPPSLTTPDDRDRVVQQIRDALPAEFIN